MEVLVVLGRRCQGVLVGKASEFASHRSSHASSIEQAHFGDLANRSQQHGVPIELIASAVPADAACGKSIRAESFEHCSESM